MLTSTRDIQLDARWTTSTRLYAVGYVRPGVGSGYRSGYFVNAICSSSALPPSTPVSDLHGNADFKVTVSAVRCRVGCFGVRSRLTSTAPGEGPSQTALQHASETPRPASTFFSRTSSRHLVDWWRSLVPPTPSAERDQITEMAQIGPFRLRPRRRHRAYRASGVTGADQKLDMCSGQSWSTDLMSGCNPASAPPHAAEHVEGTPEGCRLHSAGESRASIPPVSHFTEVYTAPAAVSALSALRHCHLSAEQGAQVLVI